MLAQWKVALAFAALATIGLAYFKGRADGDALAEADARRQVVEQITERNEINEAVSGMSAADLCRELGGVFDGQCN